MKNFKVFLSAFMLLIFTTSTTCVQNKTPISKDYSVHSFSSITSNAVGNVIYTQSDRVSVKAEGRENMINNLIITEKDGLLKIDFRKKARSLKKDNLTIYISSPTIESIENSGVGNFKLNGKVKTNDLKVYFEGVGNFEALDLESQHIEAIYEGVGNLILGGTTESLKVELEGVGSINAKELIAKNVVASSSGVGSVKCYASHSIDITNNGVGSITYYGDPAIKNIKNEGVGKAKPGK